MATLTQTIPAPPVRDLTAAVALSRDRLGCEVLCHDRDGNLLTFFTWVSA